MAGSSLESSPASETISKPLAADAEKQLSAVPDVIGEPEALAVVEDEGETLAATNQARIQALVDLGFVDVETAGELADDLFNFIADKAGSDHWKLKPNNRERLARPGAACINGAIQRLFEALPDAVGESASAHPEYAALVLALGSVAAPRLLKQLKVRKQARAGGVVKAESAPAKLQTKIKAGPLGGIPEASGTLQ